MSGEIRGDVLIGVSGWRYARWRGDFYPKGLPQRRELEYVGNRFRSVELNGSFSSLPRTTAEALALAGRHDDRLEGRSWLDIEADAPLRHAVEPRSATFDDPECLRMLQRHGVALVAADTAGRWPRFDALTADFAYVRLHGATVLYRSGYTSTELQEWAGLVRAWADGTGTGDGQARDVYVYFDNDARGHAPHDALALRDLVEDPEGSA